MNQYPAITLVIKILGDVKSYVIYILLPHLFYNSSIRGAHVTINSYVFNANMQALGTILVIDNGYSGFLPAYERDIQGPWCNDSKPADRGCPWPSSDHIFAIDIHH